MTVFLSTYRNTLDKKGRVSVPSPFRLLLEASGFAGFVAYPSFLYPCIEACSLKRMEVLAHGIEQLDPFSEERHAFAAAILTESVPIPFDGDGLRHATEVAMWMPPSVQAAIAAPCWKAPPAG